MSVAGGAQRSDTSSLSVVVTLLLSEHGEVLDDSTDGPLLPSFSGGSRRYRRCQPHGDVAELTENIDGIPSLRLQC